MNCGIAAFFLWAAVVPSFAQTVAGLTPIGTAVVVRGYTQNFHGSSRHSVALGAGDPVYLNDKIVTDNVGQVEIKLQDETVFSIGPNSALVLDKYVYDPASSTAEILISVLNGVFRFISGKVAKSGPLNMKVNLPVCTIGIHGTEVAGDVDGSRKAVVYHVAGKPIDVFNGFGAQKGVKPGFMVSVNANQAPAAPVPTPPVAQKGAVDVAPISAAPPDAPQPAAALPAPAAPAVDLQAAALETLQKLAAEYAVKRRAAFMRLLSDDFLGNEETLEAALIQDFRNYSSVNLQIIPDKVMITGEGERISVLFRYNLALISNQGAAQNFSGQAEYLFRWERGQARLYKMSSPIIFGNSLPPQQAPIAQSQGTAVSNSGSGGTASSAPGAANGCGGTLQCGSGEIDDSTRSFNFPQGVETSFYGPTADVGLSGPPGALPDDIVAAGTNKVSNIGNCDPNTLTTVATPTATVITTYGVGDCIVVTTRSPAGYFAVMKLTAKTISGTSTTAAFTYMYQSNGSNRFH